jgi:putative DNA primase/helicase
MSIGANATSVLVDIALGREQNIAKLERVWGLEAFTESGQADRFAEEFKGIVARDADRGRWLIWHRHRWMPDTTGEVHDHIRAAARGLLNDAGFVTSENERERTIKFAMAMLSARAIRNIEFLARSHHDLVLRNLDADPFLLGVANGVVDLRTGVLRDGERADKITMAAGVSFIPDATCPRWERALREWFADDLALIEYIAQCVGYALTGDVREQSLWFLYNTGAGGKSTFLKVLRRIMGDYAMKAPASLLQLGDRSSLTPEIVQLMGRRFVTLSESNEGTRLNEARIKDLTGGETVSGRPLYGAPVEFTPVAKYFFSVNHKPVVVDDSHGFWRRMRLVPFARAFTGEAEDKSLDERLWAEAEGILAWAVRGCLAWQRDGLMAPASVLQATSDYKEDSDPLAEFVTAACEPCDHAEVRASDLFAHYRAWADKQGIDKHAQLTATMFGRRLGMRFVFKKTSAGKVYFGLAPRHEDEQ